MMTWLALAAALLGLDVQPSPPRALLIGRARGVVASGRAGGAFLGRRELPEDDRHASLVPDPAAPVAAYFRDVTGDADLELQLQTLTDDSDRYAFIQSVQGVPIIGTFALAQLEDGMLHYARHYLVRTPDIDTHPLLDAALAQRLGVRESQHFAAVGRPAHGAPSLAVAYEAETPHLIWLVPVETEAPFGVWAVYIDAKDGEALGHYETSMSAQTIGSVTAMVEPNCQGDRVLATLLPDVEYSRGMATDREGGFAAMRAVDEAVVRLSGPAFRVLPFDGEAYTFRTQLHPAPAFNEVVLSPPLSHVDPFYYASRARAWVRMRLNELGDIGASRLVNWTNVQVPIRVDLPTGHNGFRCNAFYDGTGLNFYEEDKKLGCVNSGRIAKIVFHEYGHGIHDHLSWSRATFDGQVSEGAGDYIAATITGDPNITGLMGCDKILPGRTTMRTCENHYTYCRSRKCNSHPRDEVHNAAPILCGALWELRQELGAADADHLFIKFLMLVSDMDSAYQAMIAADDDDDGDPSNGTRHSCVINRAFLGADGGIAHFPEQRAEAVPCVQMAVPLP